MVVPIYIYIYIYIYLSEREDGTNEVAGKAGLLLAARRPLLSAIRTLHPVCVMGIRGALCYSSASSRTTRAPSCHAIYTTLVCMYVCVCPAPEDRSTTR